MRRSRSSAVAAAVLAVAGALTVARAGEVLEEVVAKVNDDVITKTDLEDREQQVLPELYRAFTCPELDAKVAEAKGMLLQRMIDDKVLLHRAQKLFDMNKVGDMYLRMFTEQQKLTQAELEEAHEADGITADELKRRLVEMSAPAEVVRFEVSDRIAVGDRDGWPTDPQGPCRRAGPRHRHHPGNLERGARRGHRLRTRAGGA